MLLDTDSAQDTSSASSTSETLPPEFRFEKIEGEQQIRVLRVSRDEQDNLSLNIRLDDLRFPTVYTAVSYKWGSSEQTTQLKIDGKLLSVQKDVYEMLLNLSIPGRTRSLWVDALCIDQSNTEERNVQVRLMGQIYCKASYVIAYIKGSDHVNYRTAHKSGRIRDTSSLYDSLDNIRQAVLQNNVELLTDDFDYVRFFENEYFNRRWIIQEICLARSVTFHCDGYELSMGILKKYFALFGQRHGFDGSAAAKLCRTREEMSISKFSLHDLIYRYESAVCHERFDKIFALLALSSSGDREITVDYNMSPISLLIELVHATYPNAWTDTSEVLNFACFLYRHLDITLEEYTKAVHDINLKRVAFSGLHIQSWLMFRGVIKNHRSDHDIEDIIHSLRPYLPPLHQFEPVWLYSASPPVYPVIGSYEFLGKRMSHQHSPLVNHQIDALDLCAFVAASKRSDKPMIGLSSCPVEQNDQLWQYIATPVALVARKEGDRVVLVGRAFLFNDDIWKPEFASGIMSSINDRKLTATDIMQWLTPCAEEHDPVTIAIRDGELLTLMRWVSMLADGVS